MVNNRRVVLASRPAGHPEVSNLSIDSQEINLEASDVIQEGEILVKTEFLSSDPYILSLFGRPGDVPRKTPPEHQQSQFKDVGSITEIGALAGGRGVGTVIKSKNPKIAVGDLVAADWKWQEYAIFNPDTEKTFEKLDKTVFGHGAGAISPSTAVGVLGVSGSHAYWGYQSLSLKKGDTLVVSAAAGNIGIVVGQIAKIYGVRVIGIAGGQSKSSALVAQGLYDEAIDYQAFSGNNKGFADRLKELAPGGIDGYFDSVGGDTSRIVFAQLKPGAHVYTCGAVSEYTSGLGFSALFQKKDYHRDDVHIQHALQLKDTYVPKIPEARAKLVQWISEGKLKPIEHITEGIEKVPTAFVEMYRGKNLGKAVIHVK